MEDRRNALNRSGTWKPNAPQKLIDLNQRRHPLGWDDRHDRYILRYAPVSNLPRLHHSVRLQLEELEGRTLLSGSGDFVVNYNSYAQDHIIVHWNNQAPASSAYSTSMDSLGNNTYNVYLQSGVSVSQALGYYSALAGVAYAQPDYQISLQGTPNDTYYGSQWDMTKIDAPDAWKITTGSNSTIVAVIDTGIDYNHPDLQNNLWHNTDGSVGWNFVANNNNPYDDNGHGTHVSGTIGAEGNNGMGVAGVDWNVRIMALKFLDSSGSGSTSNAVKAIYYADSHGAKILNASWAGGSYDSALATAIAYSQQQGIIMVVAAGNSSTNNDTTATYPADYNYNNVVAVAATDQYDNLASYSNYGPNSVALAAPGTDILSTTPNDTYSYYSGTSMATPHVTGALALVWSEHPDWNYSQVIGAVLNSVDKLSSLSGKVETGGRLDLYKAVTYGSNPAGPYITQATYSGSSAYTINNLQVTFDTSINVSTFTTKDVNLVGPTGNSITVLSITPVSGSNNTVFNIAFTTQSSAGTYYVAIGPSVTDTNGKEMDQNKNGVAGEWADRYTGSYVFQPSSSYSNSTYVPISDFQYVSSGITVNQNVNISSLTITVYINHTYDADLVLYLYSPSGQVICLSFREGKSGQNYWGTTFSDSASTSITQASAPFSGSYQPSQPLSSFNGTNAAGTWYLVVGDVQAQDTGAIDSWSMTVQGSLIASSTNDSQSSTSSSTSTTSGTAPTPWILNWNPAMVQFAIPGPTASIDSALPTSASPALATTLFFAPVAPQPITPNPIEIPTTANYVQTNRAEETVPVRQVVRSNTGPIGHAIDSDSLMTDEEVLNMLEAMFVEL